MKIEYFEANLDTVVIRFFLMMAVIIAGVFSGQYWLAGMGLPLFLSALMGIKFSHAVPKREAKIKTLRKTTRTITRKVA